MPRPTSSTTTTKPTRKLRKRSLLIALVVLATVAGVGFQMYQRQQLLADKARFTQAEKDIAALTAEITAAVGEPAKSVTNNFCSRPNMKFNEGPLSCNVEKIMFYGSEKVSDANTIVRSSSSILDVFWSSRSGLGDNVGEFDQLYNVKPSNTDEKYAQLRNEYTLSNNMMCKAIYTLYSSSSPPPYSNYTNLPTFPHTLAIKIGCGNFAKSPYYSLN